MIRNHSLEQFKKTKETVKNFGSEFNDEQILEIQKSISALSELISEFEKRKKLKGTAPP